MTVNELIAELTARAQADPGFGEAVVEVDGMECVSIHDLGEVPKRGRMVALLPY